MKIRTDYVTNSSSSCYVIAYKDIPSIDEETSKKYPAMVKLWTTMIKEILDDGEKISTIEQYNEWFIERYGWKDQTIEELLEEEDYYKKNYEKGCNYMNKGYSIIEKSVDYSEETMEYIIKSLHDKENFIIISED